MTRPSKDPNEAPNPLLSPRKQKQRELRLLAGEARRKDEQQLGFCTREFVLCGLPYKRQDSLVHERRDGGFSLRVEASPRYGMPYGQDRLIPIWLATAFFAAGCPQDGTIYIRFASDILRAFGTPHPLSGVEFQRLRGRLERIFGATYYVQDSSGPRGVWKEEGYRLIRRVSLWFDQKFRPNQYAQGQSFIQLSADFASDLRKAVVPIDLNTVKALKQQPAVLDLYIWQAWRSYRLGKTKGIGSPRDKNQEPLRIPIFKPGGLRWQLGTEAKERYKAKQLLRQWQQGVKEAWPECPNELSEDTEVFLIRPAQAIWPTARPPFLGAVRNRPLTPPLPSQTPSPNPDLFLVSDEEQETPE